MALGDGEAWPRANACSNWARSQSKSCQPNQGDPQAARRSAGLLVAWEGRGHRLGATATRLSKQLRHLCWLRSRRLASEVLRRGETGALEAMETSAAVTRSTDGS